MNRWERLKLSTAIATLVFFIQVVLLVVNIQFVDQATGQFRLAAQFRFKFVDETSREFVLVSQLQRLPEELVLVTEVSIAVAVLCYATLGLYYPTRRESFPTKRLNEEEISEEIQNKSWEASLNDEDTRRARTKS